MHGECNVTAVELKSRFELFNFFMMQFRKPHFSCLSESCGWKHYPFGLSINPSHHCGLLGLLPPAGNRLPIFSVSPLNFVSLDTHTLINFERAMVHGEIQLEWTLSFCVC